MSVMLTKSDSECSCGERATFKRNPKDSAVNECQGVQGSLGYNRAASWCNGCTVRQRSCHAQLFRVHVLAMDRALRSQVARVFCSLSVSWLSFSKGWLLLLGDAVSAHVRHCVLSLSQSSF